MASADETVRRLQEELRKRNLYFGEVDGRESEAVHEGLKRYQQRKGFSPTGRLETESLASLGVSAPKNADTIPAWPEETVLKSDAARELMVEDQRALDELIEAPPAAIAEGTEDEPNPADPESASIKSSQDASPPLTPATRNPAVKEPQPPVKEAPVAEKPAPALVAEVEKFVRDYLQACETNDLNSEMAFYAPAIRYFDQGTVNRDFVQKDVQRYYKHWPKRNYSLLSLQVAPHPKSPSDYIARFRIRFTVSNDKGHATGETDNVFAVHVENGVLKFSSLHEARVRS